MGAYLKKKRLREQFSAIHFVAVVITTLFLFVSYKFIIGQAQHHRAFVEAERLHQQVTELQARQEALQEQVAYVGSDRYVEYVARTQLKWTRPGETAVVVVPSSHEIAPVVNSTGTAQQEESAGRSSPIKAWWQVFFNTAPPEELTPR